MAKSVKKLKKPRKTKTTGAKSTRSKAVATKKKASGGGATGLAKGQLDNDIAAYVSQLLIDFTQSADFAQAVENIVILMLQYRSNASLADQQSPGSYQRQGGF